MSRESLVTNATGEIYRIVWSDACIPVKVNPNKHKAYKVKYTMLPPVLVDLTEGDLEEAFKYGTKLNEAQHDRT